MESSSFPLHSKITSGAKQAYPVSQAGSFLSSGSEKGLTIREILVSYCMKTVLVRFESQKASPEAVDSDNNVSV